jgi:hypothetical protein
MPVIVGVGSVPVLQYEPEEYENVAVGAAVI